MQFQVMNELASQFFFEIRHLHIRLLEFVLHFVPVAGVAIGGYLCVVGYCAYAVGTLASFFTQVQLFGYHIHVLAFFLEQSAHPVPSSQPVEHSQDDGYDDDATASGTIVVFLA